MKQKTYKNRLFNIKFKKNCCTILLSKLTGVKIYIFTVSNKLHIVFATMEIRIQVDLYKKFKKKLSTKYKTDLLRIA